MMDVQASAGSQVILRDQDGRETAVPLYSPEGVEMLTALRLKQMAEFRTMYEPISMGMRVIQVPNDIVAMQELIWQVRPDAIVEIGVAHGGSLTMYAAYCELLGSGKVLGIDLEIRAENRRKIEAHPFTDRIELFECSSLDDQALSRARGFCEGAREVIVILDSNHTAEHVGRELEMYADLVSANGYLVVMDGGQAFVSDIPRGNPAWHADNPLVAIRDFLADHDDFEVDPHYTRFGVTSCPEGFLRRKSKAV